MSPVPDTYAGWGHPGQAPRRVDPRGDRGSAAVEFVLVGILLTALFAALLQLGLNLHIRNVLVACAAEGARYGANADRTPADGAERARELIGESLSARFSQDVTASVEEREGAALVVVTVRAPLPVVALLGPDRTLVATGHALQEGT